MEALKTVMSLICLPALYLPPQHCARRSLVSAVFAADIIDNQQYNNNGMEWNGMEVTHTHTHTHTHRTMNGGGGGGGGGGRNGQWNGIMEWNGMEWKSHAGACAPLDGHRRRS